MVIVVIKMIRRRSFSGRTIECRSVHDETIGSAIVVVIENRDACACRFDNVFFFIDSAENIRHRKFGSLGYIYEIGESFGLLRSLSCECGSNDKKNERG